MPTFRHGKGAVVKLATIGTPTVMVDLSNVFREFNLPREVDIADTTAFGSSNQTGVPGIPGATLTGSGMFDATADAQLAAMVGSEVYIGWEYGPEGSATGRIRYTQAGSTVGLLVTSYEVNAAVADMVSFSFEAFVSGAITRNTWP